MKYPILVKLLLFGEHTQGFKKRFWVDIFLYLLNVIEAAAPKQEQHISEIMFQF